LFTCDHLRKSLNSLSPDSARREESPWCAPNHARDFG
jgi:hypothetical protein